MKYAYYPGCSLTESAREFDVSTRAVMERLGVELVEIPDWTCCGASAAEPVSKLMNYVLPARNLAIVEHEMDGIDILAPCAACYLNLYKVNREVVWAIAICTASSTKFWRRPACPTRAMVKVRHLIDVLKNDVGAKIVEQKVTDGLKGMKIAPYYGCQILRPYPVFDDPGKPVSMEPFIEAMGGEVFDWSMKNRCCGASLMVGHPEVAVKSVAAILADAEGADAIVTVCPLCQMNLEAYQDKAAKEGGKAVPVLYLTQLLGLALGLDQAAMQFDKNLTLTPAARKDIENRAWAVPEPENEAETAGVKG